jgi:hypothetical protein
MLDYVCLWDVDEEPTGNVQHVAEHGLTKADVEHAIEFAGEVTRSRSSGQPLLFGPALDGGTIAVVFERVDETYIYPVTAYRTQEDSR